MSQWTSFLQGSYRQAKRVVIAIVGFTVLLGGVVLLFTPGPAFVVIPIGLGILAIEFAWAKRWLNNIKDKAKDAADRWNGKKAGQINNASVVNTSDKPGACDSTPGETSAKRTSVIRSEHPTNTQNACDHSAKEPEAH